MMKKRKVEPWIQIDSGVKFHFDNPGNIVIEDIAHALSNQCRFAGHSKTLYSVAEHSILVSSILPNSLKLLGLMHDAAEAYLQDITKPWKDYMDSDIYKSTEAKTQELILKTFDITPCGEHEIKVADLFVLRAEAEQVFKHPPIDGWHLGLPKYPGEIKVEFLEPEAAEKLFLKTFHELKGE